MPADSVELAGASMKPKILIVEDNITQQRVMTVVAERFGLLPEVAGSGIQALAAIQNQRYELVLMDWRMPEMDGIECSKKIRELEADLGRRTPIIAVTAQDEDSIVRECLQNGMDGFLSKPFTVEQFAAIIEYWLVPQTQAPSV